MTQIPRQPALGLSLRAERRRRGISLRDLADETGVSFNTLSRVERGHLPDLTNYERITKWLGAPGIDFFYTQDDVSTTNIIAKHLYADTRLGEEQANQLLLLIRDMYAKLATPEPAFAVHLRSGQTFVPEVGTKLASALADMHATLLQESK